MNNQARTVVLQWVSPTLALILILAIMMYNFSTKAELTANNTVSSNMISSAQNSVSDFSEQLLLLKQVGEPIAALLGTEDELNSEYAEKLIKIAKEYTGASEAWACYDDGNGLGNNGQQVSLEGLDCFAEIQAAKEITYLYTEYKNSVITVVPITGETVSGHLLLFYPLTNLEVMIKKGDVAIWNIVTLIDVEGNVLYTDGTKDQWEIGDNLLDVLSKGNSAAVNKIKKGISTSTSAMTPVKMDAEENVLIYTPLAANNWMLIVGVSQMYIDRMVLLQYQSFRNMLYQLLAANIIFLCIIVGVNIVTKLYGNKKQKQLEIKADTDLLTGLNNKLATERKIKEFIEHNPNAQSMMFVLDIDNFKKINDTMGHAFGDVVLSTLGHTIGALFRATDIVGRAGGDEFIIFLKNISSPEIIRKEAKKVENFFKDFKAGEYTKYSATASIGVAIYPQEGADFESIYKAADQALYKAKKRGKNQLAYYKDEWAIENSEVNSEETSEEKPE